MKTTFITTGTNTPLATPPSPPPRLAEGVELIGEYQDSGLKDPPYLVRLRGGRIAQLPQLLYRVAEAIDGERTTAEIGEVVGDELELRISADQIQFLLDHKLRPLGVLAGTDVRGEPLDAAPLAFTMRKAFVPPVVVRSLAAVLRHFFRPMVVGAALAWLLVLDVWLYFEHGLGSAIGALLVDPTLLLLVFGLMLASTIFHELGHAAACRYGGARPGGIGAGLYYVWPAFFTDVTDAYRLDRRGRLRTDFGGIYFNVLFMLGVAAAYYRTHYEPLLVFVALQHLQILNQFIPWVRLDGYYVLTDLTGVPDVLTRVKPVLLSMIPDRETPPSVAELKPWVRVALRVYVVTLIPVMALTFVLLVLHAPRFFAAAATSLHAQESQFMSAVGRGEARAAALAALQFVLLLLPALGMTLTLLRVVRAILRRIFARGGLRRTALAIAGAAIVGAAGFAAATAADRAPVRGKHHHGGAESGTRVVPSGSSSSDARTSTATPTTTVAPSVESTSEGTTTRVPESTAPVETGETTIETFETLDEATTEETTPTEPVRTVSTDTTLSATMTAPTTVATTAPTP